MGRHERRAVVIPAKGTPPPGESWRVFYGDPEEEWAWVDLPGLSWEDAQAVMAVLVGVTGRDDGCADCSAAAAGVASSLAAVEAGEEWEAEWGGHALRILRA